MRGIYPDQLAADHIGFAVTTDHQPPLCTGSSMQRQDEGPMDMDNAKALITEVGDRLGGGGKGEK